MRELEVWWDGLRLDSGGKGRISADVIMVDQGGMVELLNPLIHVLKLLIESVILIMDLRGPPAIDGKNLSKRKIMVRVGALYFLFSLL